MACHEIRCNCKSFLRTAWKQKQCFKCKHPQTSHFKTTNICVDQSKDLTKWRVVCTRYNLRVRDAPITSARIIDSLIYNTIIVGQKKNNWVHHKQGWSQISNNIETYLIPEVVKENSRNTDEKNEFLSLIHNTFDIRWWISPSPPKALYSHLSDFHKKKKKIRLSH